MCFDFLFSGSVLSDDLYRASLLPRHVRDQFLSSSDHANHVDRLFYGVAPRLELVVKTDPKEDESDDELDDEDDVTWIDLDEDDEDDNSEDDDNDTDDSDEV